MVRQKMILSRWTIKAWLLLLPFYLFTFLPLHAAKDKTFTLVIDAGHGGHDAGASWHSEGLWNATARM